MGHWSMRVSVSLHAVCACVCTRVYVRDSGMHAYAHPPAASVKDLLNFLACFLMYSNNCFRSPLDTKSDISYIHGSVCKRRKRGDTSCRPWERKVCSNVWLNRLKQMFFSRRDLLVFLTSPVCCVPVRRLFVGFVCFGGVLTICVV